LGKPRTLLEVLRYYFSVSSLNLNFHRYLASEQPLSEVIAQAETAPFLSEKRLVLLMGVEDLNAGDRKIIAQYFEKSPRFSQWILTTGETKFTKMVFLNKISKKAEVILCRAPYREAEIRQWIKDEVLKLNKKISFEAMRQLIELTGRDLTELKKRVELLSIYIGDRNQIAEEDVDSLLGESVDQNVFQLYESLEKKNFTNAYKIVDKLKDEGRRAHEIIAALVWQFERNLKVKNLLDAGLGPGDVSKNLGIHPYFLDQTVSLARGMTQSRFEEQLKVLSRCDQDIKSGYLNSDLALQKCLLSLNRD